MDQTFYTCWQIYYSNIAFHYDLQQKLYKIMHGNRGTYGIKSQGPGDLWS